MNNELSKKLDEFMADANKKLALIDEALMKQLHDDLYKLRD